MNKILKDIINKTKLIEGACRTFVEKIQIEKQYGKNRFQAPRLDELISRRDPYAPSRHGSDPRAEIRIFAAFCIARAGG